MRRNLAQLAEKVRIMIGDGNTRAYSGTAIVTTGIPSDVYNFPDGSSHTLSDLAYRRYVSNAYLDVAKELNYADCEYTEDTVASTATVSTDLFSKVYGVEIDGTPLTPINAAALYRLDQKWQTRTGRPLMWLQGQKQAWGYSSSNANREYQTIRLYPTPSTSGLEIRLIGVAKPEPLVNDFESPYMPDFMCDIVVYQACKDILSSHTELRNPRLAEAYGKIREGLMEAAQSVRVRRQWDKIWVAGESVRTPYTLVRNKHIPYTGLAPGDPE